MTEKIKLDSFTDRYGNEIVRGNVIVYGNNLGRCAKTAIGKVLDIFDGEEDYWGRKQARLSILSIQSDHRPTKKYPETGDLKKVMLKETDRVLLYSKDFLPPHLRILLDA